MAKPQYTPAQKAQQKQVDATNKANAAKRQSSGRGSPQSSVRRTSASGARYGTYAPPTGPTQHKIGLWTLAPKPQGGGGNFLSGGKQSGVQRALDNAPAARKALAGAMGKPSKGRGR